MNTLELALAQTRPKFSTDTARYRALLKRDPLAEGEFYYSVLTTGIYCRPTCASRLPRPENVRFFETAEDAERAGYRACKRCQPREGSAGEQHIEIIKKLQTLLERATATPRLNELAKSVGLSSYYVHHLFKKHVGMTPREYAAAHRLQRVDKELREHKTITAAFFDAGYGSSGRFYDEASGALGMEPSELRQGGRGLEIETCVRMCSLGHVLVAATVRGVCAVAFGDHPSDLLRGLRKRFPRANICTPNETLEGLANHVIAMVEARTTARAQPPLDLIGTAFQQRVWRALREIPAGETITYSELADRIGAPRSIRAVGTACGKNPVAVLVPCHRVVPKIGGLGGYRWGVERKRALLRREGKSS